MSGVKKNLFKEINNSSHESSLSITPLPFKRILPTANDKKRKQDDQSQDITGKPAEEQRAFEDECCILAFVSGGVYAHLLFYIT
jgi:hypothetical protein